MGRKYEYKKKPNWTNEEKHIKIAFELQVHKTKLPVDGLLTNEND